jgi:cell division protein FtsI (penicillin-binding protein 3)
VKRAPHSHPVRYWLVLGAMLAAMSLLAARAVYLQVWHSGYLQEQGNARHLRIVEDVSHRGMILDRNGEPLAISTPVDSVWANPAELDLAHAQWPALMKLLDLSRQELAGQINKNSGREFMYLKRHVRPELAEQVMALKIPGVALQKEYRRYYPAGAMAGHVVGFTNVDDQGQEGLELAYDAWLRAVPGKKRILKDRLGNVVETVESITLPVPGKDLTVSLDRRIQYLAYRELKAAVAAHGAHGGSAIVMDARTGEVIAMVNEPGFNPNNRTHLRSSLFRNRAVTDVFEPGSTVKPFTVAAALESGKFLPNTPVETAPGSYKIGEYFIRDARDYGRLTVAEVIEKSSNVGASKISLALNKSAMWRMFHAVGFGDYTGAELPGESAGRFTSAKSWVPIEQATVSFGYGLSVTPLQLARAYTALANNGILMPVTLLRRDTEVKGQRAMKETNARAIRRMLEMAVSKDGTGAAARVMHYRVAGKTGTVHKLGADGYAENAYVASFAGFAPASDPRLIMVVTIDQPARGGYFGGQAAAPVFSKVMSGALRLLNIPLDEPYGPALDPIPKVVQAASEGVT